MFSVPTIGNKFFSKVCNTVLKTCYVLCERERGWCQSNANQSPNIKIKRISRRQLTPFGHGRSAVLLEYFAAVETTFEIEMIADRSMDGRELLQGLYVPKFRHRSFPSSERLV